MKSKYDKYTSLMILLVFIFFSIKVAWLSDDGYITITAAKHLAEGNGLTTNVGERVQSFTNPLLALIYSGLFFIFKEYYYTPMFFNLFCSYAAIFILSKYFKDKSKLLCIMPLFVWSRSFIDFSSSGLENSLIHLLFSIFLIYRCKDNKNLIIEAFISCLLVFSRMDMCIILLPILCYDYLNFKRYTKKQIFINIGKGIIGYIPFLCWCVFALIYYGFIFPNTFYSKLYSGISQIYYLKNGLIYYFYSICYDPILIVIFILLLYLLLIKRPKIQKDSLCILLGVVFYYLYIIKIGGDFMCGRYLSFTFCPLLFVMMNELNIYKKQIYSFLLTFCSIFCISFFTAHMYEDCSISSSPLYIGNERSYYSWSNLFFRVDSDGLNNFKKIHTYFSKVYDEDIDSYISQPVIAIGMVGSFDENNSYIIDKVGLSNVLLARLPYENILLGQSFNRFRPGHVTRIIPDGYIESVKTNSNKIKDKYLNDYYDKVIILTRSPIFSKERFKVILNFNLGKYDYLINKYIQNYAYSKL